MYTDILSENPSLDVVVIVSCTLHEQPTIDALLYLNWLQES